MAHVAPLECKTFKEWKAAGYHVMKGQKSSGRNAQGEATFSQKQVEKNKPRSKFYHYHPDMDEGTDYEDDRLQAEAYLGDRDWFI